MTWYAWVLIAYIALERLMTVAQIGKRLEITPPIAVESLITGGLMIWLIVSLANA